MKLIMQTNFFVLKFKKVHILRFSITCEGNSGVFRISLMKEKRTFFFP
jgi:hypothetical protein